MPDSSTPPVVGTRVRVVYLARLREAFGHSEEPVTLAGDAPTVADLLATLRARGEPFAHELAPGRAVRVAVNHDIASAQTRVSEGDEIALLPPVTGG